MAEYSVLEVVEVRPPQTHRSLPLPLSHTRTISVLEVVEVRPPPTDRRYPTLPHARTYIHYPNKDPSPHLTINPTYPHTHTLFSHLLSPRLKSHTPVNCFSCPYLFMVLPG